MAIKVELGEETTLNMTPMIDINFNLVIFFMLTLDLSSKDYMPLTLAFAHNGVEDKDDTADPIQSLKVVVNLLPDGKIVLKGNTYEMASDDPAKQTQALKALHEEMKGATEPDRERPNTREEDGHSKIAVQIHGDRESLWKYAQWIIGVASSKQIRMYKIYFSVKQPISDLEKAGGAAPAKK